MDSQLRNEITEAILRRAAKEANEREMAAIPTDDVLKKLYSFSETHETRMRALFRRAERREILSEIYSTSKRVAVIVLVLTTAVFCILLTDSRVQAAIKETLIKWYEGFTMLRFQTDEHTTDEVDWFPDFIPDNFETTDVIEFYNGKHIFYEHPNGEYIIFEYSPATDTTAHFDNDYTKMEIILLNGTEYFVIIPLPGSEHDSQVYWQMSGYTFQVISGLDSEMLLEIAESVTHNSP